MRISLKLEDWVTVRDALDFMAREYGKSAEKYRDLPARGMLLGVKQDVERIKAVIEAETKIDPIS